MNSGHVEIKRLIWIISGMIKQERIVRIGIEIVVGQLLFENVELEGINLDKTPYNYYFRNNKNKLVPKSQSWNNMSNKIM